MTNWTSVKDRLPEEPQEVYVHIEYLDTGERKIEIMCLSKNTPSYLFDKYHEMGERRHKKIIHWALSPELPN